MRTFALAVAAAACGVALACSDVPTAPHRFGDALTITATPVAVGNDTTEDIGLSAHDNLLYISGRIATPDPCFDLSAFRSIQGNELRVTIVATRQAKSCASVIDHFDFSFVTDRPPCPHLTVWYHVEGADWPDRKLVDELWLCAFAAAPGDRQAAGRLM